MEDTALLKQSKVTKAVADKILADSGIVQKLAKLGEVKLVGSYALDLMLRPDIDLYVVAPKYELSNVKALMTELMEQRYFSEISFLNWVDFPIEDHIDIQGYYFQPCLWVDGVFWKLDVWLITPEYDRDVELTQKSARLLAENPEKRALILEIKQAMRSGSKYEKGVDGQRIYKAVLEDGIGSVEEFRKALS